MAARLFIDEQGDMPVAYNLRVCVKLEMKTLSAGSEGIAS
jgi:hypothetical protein